MFQQRKRRALFPSGRISRAEVIAVLASPVRQEIMDTIEALGGTATVNTLAEQLGRAADGLYYHLKRLAGAGLLVEELGRSRAGREERRYRIPIRRGENLSLVYRPRDRGNVKAVRRLVGGMLRIARRDFDAALAVPGVVVSGARRELWAGRSTGWLSKAELTELNRLLARLAALFRQRRRRGREHLASLCFVLAPLAAQPKRR